MITQPGTSRNFTNVDIKPFSVTGTADDNDDENSDEDELDEDAPTEQKLMYKLMRHYEKSVRPVRNASDTVLVRMGLTLDPDIQHGTAPPTLLFMRFR
jgi:hypothetical protein